MIPGLSTVKLIGLAIAAASILSFVLLALHWKHQAADRGEKLAVICQATRTASGQPKLKCSEVPKQIQFMGEAIDALTSAIHRQNAAVDALATESAKQKRNAAQAAQDAAERAKASQKASESLIASSRDPARQGAPCTPSKALSGAWR